MSVTIASDLVAGVLQAGSPNRIDAATRRLATGGAAGFGAELLAAEKSTAPPSGDLVLDVIAAADPVRAASAESKLAGLEKMATFQKFEASLLSTVFESVLPESGSGTFGEGFAGGVWRSMEAEQFANLFATRGGVGIANLLAERINGNTDSPAEANPSMAGKWPYFHLDAISAFQT